MCRFHSTFLSSAELTANVRGLASGGDSISQMYKLMTKLPNKTKTLIQDQNPACAKHLCKSSKFEPQIKFI